MSSAAPATSGRRRCRPTGCVPPVPPRVARSGTAVDRQTRQHPEDGPTTGRIHEDTSQDRTGGGSHGSRRTVRSQPGTGSSCREQIPDGGDREYRERRARGAPDRSHGDENARRGGKGTQCRCDGEQDHRTEQHAIPTENPTETPEHRPHGRHPPEESGDEPPRGSRIATGPDGDGGQDHGYRAHTDLGGRRAPGQGHEPQRSGRAGIREHASTLVARSRTGQRVLPKPGNPAVLGG